MKILVIDDDPVSRRVLRQIIAVAQPGCEIVDACNGEEACMLLEREVPSFDVAFLDLSMPDHHGIDLLGRFRRSTNLRNLPIIVCTSSNDRPTVVNAVAAGATHYIVKPPSAALVSDKLRIVQIGIKAASRQAAPVATAPTPPTPIPADAVAAV